MTACLRVLFALFWICTAESLLAQGGFGGAAAGGFQGGQGGAFEGGDVFQRELFLSPGDRTEWEFEAKEGDAYLISVTSSVFDPAVAILQDGKKLVENDDIEPGNQMARLLFVAPLAGKFKAVVTNYKGTAGGAFEFASTKVSTFPLPVGKPTNTPADPKVRWARVNVPAPGSYVITDRAENFGRGAMLSPTGESMSFIDGSTGLRVASRRVLIKVPGIYLIRSSAEGAGTLAITPTSRTVVEAGRSEIATLKTDEYADWSVQVKKGQVLQVDVSSRDPRLTFFWRTGGVYDESIASSTILTQSRFGETTRQIVPVTRDGVLAMTVRQGDGQPASYTVSTRTLGRPLSGNAAASKLDWFTTDVWNLSAKPGDVVVVRAKADAFVPTLILFNESGRQDSRLLGNPPLSSVSMDVDSNEPISVAVLASAVGAYRLEVEVVSPKRLAAGATKATTNRSPQIWRFRAEKDKDYLFRFRYDRPGLRAEILNPEGNVVRSLRSNVASDLGDLLRFRSGTSGEYTLRVVAEEGVEGEPFEITWIDLG